MQVRKVIRRVWYKSHGTSEELKMLERQEVRGPNRPLFSSTLFSPFLLSSPDSQDRESEWPTLSFQPSHFLATAITVAIF